MNEFKLYGVVIKTPELYDCDFCSICLREVKSNSKFHIFCYKKLAEDVCANLKKGDRCIIKGRLEHRDSDESEIELVAERIEYID